jgi:4'-phosphopantetheinyl transferase
MTPGLQPLLAPSPYELWLIDLDVDPDASSTSVLDDRERTRAARFAFERDRRRYIAAHRFLRERLAERTGVAAAHLRFAEGDFGKPRLIEPPRCAFSLSHSEGLALVALANRGEIGADIEMLRPMPDLDDLARRCFTRDEQRELGAVSPADRSLHFLRGWTRKEACLKALGAGLQIEPATFEVGLQAGVRDVSIQTPKGRADVAVQSVGPEVAFVCAVARVTSSLS